MPRTRRLARKRVVFYRKGKKVAFWTAKQTARQSGRVMRWSAAKARAYAMRQRQKTAGVKYTPYRTPAQRKGAARPTKAKARASKAPPFARCPICKALYPVNSKAEADRWLSNHVRKVHGRG